MEVIKGELTDIKGIPPSGLCVGVHRAGLMHKRMVEKHGDKVEVWLTHLRPLSRKRSNETPDWMVDRVIDHIKAMAA